MQHIYPSINTFYLFWQIVEMNGLFFKLEKEVLGGINEKNWSGVNISKVK